MSRDTRPAAHEYSIFLDQHVWIEMAKSMTNGGVYRDIYDALLERVNRRRVTVPLTAGHYLELWHRTSSHSRADVATVMREISRLSSVMSLGEMLARETVRAVEKILSATPEPLPLSHTEVFGVGVNHAFSSPTGRWRLVEAVETDSQPEGEALIPEDGYLKAISLVGADAWEWLNLVGPEDLYDIPSLNIDRRPEYRKGTAWAQEQARIRSLVSDSGDTSLLKRYLVALKLNEIAEELVESFGSEAAMMRYFTGPDAGIAFVESIPSANVRLQLELVAHRNLTYRFKQHDRGDILQLAQCIPHFDVVYPDKHWANVAISSGVASKYGTVVVQSSKQFLSLLQDL